jgi:hypothetical protein
MDELGLFTAALGLSAPWRVTRTEFDGAQLDLYLDFSRGVGVFPILLTPI